MKHLLLIVIGVIILSATVDAQYKINKTKYNFKDYKPQVGQPYNPGVSGLCSLLIPGLGQMIDGEVGRGLAFLGGDIGFGLIYIIGFFTTGYGTDNGGTRTSGAGMMVVGGIGMLAVDIWAIVDAVRVAKVNDMAFYNKPKTSLELSPYVGRYSQGVAPGVTFRVIF